MDKTRLGGILHFLKSAEALKHTLRSAHLSDGRRESTAEHSWRLCLMAMLVAREDGEIDQLKLLKLCVVHDLAEAITGDIPAIAQARENKREDEEAAMRELIAPLPADLASEIVDLWQEYEMAETREARFAKGLDKLETILQHNQGANPVNFDYEFNLDYGKKYTDANPLLAQIRGLLDEETRANIVKQKRDR